MAFGKLKDDDIPPSSPISARPDAIIGKGTTITGTIRFSGLAQIEGTIDGEVVALDKLTIDESAKIKGRIEGTEVVVKGEIEGQVIASKRLVLKKPAKVLGDITAALLSIEEGVVFNGKCSMEIPAAKTNLLTLSEKVA